MREPAANEFLASLTPGFAVFSRALPAARALPRRVRAEFAAHARAAVAPAVRHLPGLLALLAPRPDLARKPLPASPRLRAFVFDAMRSLGRPSQSYH